MRVAPRRAFAACALVGIVLAACSGTPATTAGGNATATAAADGRSSPGATSAPSAAPSRLPAAGQIVFVSVERGTGRGQIYIEQADGSGVRALVESGFDDVSPALSPDGRKVAFARNTADGLTSLGAFVVNVDGTGLRQIDANGEDPSWSPDGTQLVETRALFDPGAAAPYNVGLWIVTVASGAARQITRKGVRCPNACANGAQDSQARWSQDGKRLAFLRETYTSPDAFTIFTIGIDGSGARAVSPVGMNVADPHWSPDGTRIVFQSPPDPSPDAPQDIYAIGSDGTGLTQLTKNLPALPSGLEGAFHPAWSPDGLQIVFARFPGVNANGASLYVMRADGTDLHLLAQTDLDQNAPEWGPLPASG